MHLTESQGMHLTESHMYAFNRESHMYAFNRITRVCIKGSHVCI